MYEYSAVVKRVIDGDTLDLTIDLGLETYRLIRVRLAHVNAPEKNVAAGMEAKAYVEQWVADHGPEFRVVTTKDHKEKYGRYLADIYDKKNECLNVSLRETGHAAVYEGGPR